MNLPPRLTQGGRFLRARALWAVVFAIAGASLRFALPSPPPRSPEGVAALLGAAVNGEVRPDDFIWEERGGAAGDLVLGRRVLFLAKTADPADASRSADVFRARVRLTRAGRPISVRTVRNLTRSPLGDERDLLANGQRASFVTHAHGAAVGVTLLDLAGDGGVQGGGHVSRLAAKIEAFLDTGSSDGIARTELTFGAPPGEVRQELTAELLVVALGSEAVPASVDLRTGALNTGARDPFRARLQRLPRRASKLPRLAVRALRDLAGDAPAHLLDALTRLVPPAPVPRVPPVVFPGREPPAPTPSVDDWPPPPLRPELAPSLPGEGIWGTAWTELDPGTEGELAPLYETALRPSSRHPEQLVRLVALDLRRLDLHLQPGHAEPRSLTGVHGYGRLPIGPDAESVVAAFTAGPLVPDDVEPSPGAPMPGFAVDRRVLLPPIAGAATVALTRDGGTAFGAWAQGTELPATVEALLQTPDPLVGGTGAPRILPRAPELLADRSALGLLRSGHVIYAWGAATTAETLRSALSAAGCTYALPLGQGGDASGFAYVRWPRTGEQTWKARPLGPEMGFRAETLAEGSSLPFFYVTTRRTQPSIPLPAPTAPASNDQPAPGSTWRADAGKQPSPSWLPAIHVAVVNNLGAQIHVTTFAPGRLSWRIRAGSREPATKVSVALPGALPDADRPRALAAISLGFAKKKGIRGLAIGDATGFPFRGEASGVLLLEKGRPAIVPAEGFKLPPGADATELPLTADAGKLRPEAREVGSMRPRAAACVLADGTFLLASTTFDSDEAATQALLDLGCQRVVALDRGAHAAFLHHRSGTESAPEARYETTMLFGLDAPMPGRATRLDDE
jgi:hypothetical protein